MLTFNGKPFKSRDFKKSMMDGVLKAAKAELGERFRSIADPETGEFPTVIIYGDSLNDMSMKIEGSPQLIAHITSRFSQDDLVGVTFQEKERQMPPKVFLSFTWNDKPLVEKIAKKLLAAGIDTWWAEWEIGAGDSLVEKINHGLVGCTHFIVFLTPEALEKPWVKTEMDAGLIRMIEENCKFIPLRHNLAHTALPPLLRPLLSPEVNADLDIDQLISDIHGISKKPMLGKPPQTVELPETGYSPAATAVAQVLAVQSETGNYLDVQMSLEEMSDACELSQDDVKDALYELRNFIAYEFDTISAQPELFVEFDKHFMGWDPEKDALRIISDIYHDPEATRDTEEFIQKYDWTVRRLNAALAYLKSREICRDESYMGSNLILDGISEKQEGAFRRLVKSRT